LVREKTKKSAGVLSTTSQTSTDVVTALSAKTWQDLSPAPQFAESASNPTLVLLHLKIFHTFAHLVNTTLNTLRAT
jgi:hypothetical protein